MDVTELGEFDLDGFMAGLKDGAETEALTNKVIKKQIILALDASNSMLGYKIGAVNDAVNNLVSKLKTLDRSAGCEVSVYVIGFSARLFRWTGSFTPVSKFQYSYVETADGLTNMSALFEELADVTEKQLEDDAEKYAVLFSDGLSTEDYTKSADRWKNTGRYQDIRKIAVAFEEDLEDEQSAAFFRDFTASGSVLPIQDAEALHAILLD